MDSRARPRRRHRGELYSADRASPLLSDSPNPHDEPVAHTAVVVDDHGPTRAVVCRLVELAGADVIAEAADLAGALAVVERLRPTVLVIDVQLPDGTGIDAARMISAGPSPPRIVLMSTGDYGDGAGRCGAHAFIPKDQLSVAALMAAFE